MWELRSSFLGQHSSFLLETTQSPPPPRYSGLGYVAIFVGIAVAISMVWTQFQQVKNNAGQKLKEYGSVPSFNLLDETGRPATKKSLHGKIWVCDFITTRPTAVSIMMNNRMRDLQNSLEHAQDDRVRLISITLDPKHDTVPVLKEFSAKEKALPGRWSFLTGTPTDVENLIMKGLLSASDAGSKEIPTQSSQFVLMDPNGQIRNFRPGENPEVVGDLLLDIGSLVREFPLKSSPSSTK